MLNFSISFVILRHRSYFIRRNNMSTILIRPTNAQKQGSVKFAKLWARIKLASGVLNLSERSYDSSRDDS